MMNKTTPFVCQSSSECYVLLEPKSNWTAKNFSLGGPRKNAASATDQQTGKVYVSGGEGGPGLKLLQFVFQNCSKIKPNYQFFWMK
jgi:hypothetical protein